ncbi:pitrilysin family protein [Hyphomicrobium sp.]|uniref:M16 family metallopeptidase n=1 Tax=Hyphomicrobium sp. TaxID=82 RepID=UPI002E30D77F|nr:pitrilysin family protein [Hyphomicrobium sp.]HEX2840137.1 pitrilysin family protein [Hyphomicrobium sp.]
MMNSPGVLRLLTWIGSIMLAIAPSQLHAQPRTSEFTLDNGLQVVVIPDHRAPVVTHMIWYKVGAADEPKGVSGIAHFLEHLMFKSTDKIPLGEFSKIVARLGGQDNAFTGHDVTSYFQRISKDRLETVMDMEADRMVNLRLTEKEVLTERDVILEERRSRIENNPAAIMDEQMNAALYYSHPYGIPVIGWEHEMAKLSPHDALTFYKHFYAPNNAVLVVAGDVTADEVKALAEKTYGKIPRNPTVGATRERPTDPPQRAARRVEYSDPRAGKASFHRDYVVPSYMTAKPGEAEALDLLMKIAADGPTSRVYKRLVVEDKIASSAGGSYSGSGLDYGTISLYAIAAGGSDDLPKVEAAIDKVLAEIRENGVTEAELNRARSSYIADYIYENDDQASLARRYGWGLALGRTVQQIEGWPDALKKVTVDDIKRAANAYLDLKRSVTGYLTPSEGPTHAEQPAPKSRS